MFDHFKLLFIEDGYEVERERGGGGGQGTKGIFDRRDRERQGETGRDRWKRERDIYINKLCRREREEQHAASVFC